MTGEKIFRRGDIITGALTGLVAFLVYWATTAPNVTLLDSGEFLVAAQHFGVPHPTGYPLWTLLAWIFQLLPLGNAAWEINLFSGVCGALSVFVVTALISSSLRWLLGATLGAYRGFLPTVSAVCGLLYAFSFSVWSQATIAEVYTLHALLIGLFLVALYVWLRNPGRLRWLLLSFFILAFSFSNHHLTIAMAPLPFLGVLLVRRRIFWDLLLAAVLTALLGYLAFAILSAEQPVLKTAIRFFYCVMAGFAVLLVVRRGQIEWRLVAYLPFVVAIGLLPYAYMPLASATNPPMNWAYTSTPEGFFFSFNRSQYSGSLSQQSLRSLGRLMGTHEKSRTAPAVRNPAAERPLLARVQEWTGFFWIQLARSFTPLGVIAYFLSLFVILRLKDVRQRTWVYVLELGFVLAAILQPVADGAETDNAGWWLQMPYHTYTNFLFAVLVAIGLAWAAAALFARFPRLAGLRFILWLMPAVPLVLNVDGSSQRDRWFGWQFGHDMLKDLPKGSVVLGGTDPGRFVPTYMILGESTQAPGLKRDPDFDRRDLFIITQNGVAEPLYRRYLRDHYSAERPGARNPFEKWLGRETQYPRETLKFPTEEEIDTAVEEEIKKNGEAFLADPARIHGLVTKMIWERNKDDREFFVEESFPMEWSYDYAEPHGLVYRIHREPIKELSPEVVKKDMAFWQDYATRLLEHPDYLRDFDAQRSFSKLRSTTGGIYKHRGMMREAEAAHRQALALWAGNPDSINALNTLLVERGDYEGILKIVQTAIDNDPNNLSLWRVLISLEQRRDAAARIDELFAGVGKDPSDAAQWEELVLLASRVADTNTVSKAIAQAVTVQATNTALLRTFHDQAMLHELPETALLASDLLVATNTARGDDYLRRAEGLASQGRRYELFETLRAGSVRDPLTIRRGMRDSQLLRTWEEDPLYRELAGTNPTDTSANSRAK